MRMRRVISYVELPVYCTCNYRYVLPTTAPALFYREGLVNAPESVPRFRENLIYIDGNLGIRERFL